MKRIFIAIKAETGATLLKKISSKLKDRCEGSGNFELYIRGMGVFRNLSDPRVIWARIEPSFALRPALF
jgi:2'-5' RNA ligase